MSNLSERTIEIDGFNFVRDIKTGYYLSSKVINGERKRLHRYIWEKHYGDIPKNLQVHHKDHDKENNAIDNLAIMPMDEHLKYHSSKDALDNYEEKKARFIKNAIPAAAKWHKSAEGKAWHKKQAEKLKGRSLEPIGERSCVVCGEMFNIYASTAAKACHCSKKCKAKARRDSGIDNIVKACVICESEFTSNKYDKVKTCSRRCGGILNAENRGKN